jgi:formylglycine-generating enzyme required for sulfatase activity
MHWSAWIALAVVALAAVPQPAAHAGSDTAPPTGTVVINSNRSATNTPNVTLALTWDDGAGGSGVSRMRFSNDGATWSPWEALAAARAYALPGGDGYKTVRVQYLDRANNRSTAYNDYILLDTTPPTGTIVINNGDTATPSPSVSLGLTWSDGAGAGVTRMRFSDNGSTWTAWEPPTSTRAHALPAGLGYHTVRVQYLDGVGNNSGVYGDYIKFIPPTEETVMLPGSVPLVMVWIPGGTFTMGSPDTEQGRITPEGPQHAVTLSGYWMGKYELTKRQWQAVMGTTPWFGQLDALDDPDSPAVYVSWHDAQAFLTAANNCTGKTFRLPTEAQWECACRAGTTTRFYWGEDPGYTDILAYAWHSGTCRGAMYAHVAGGKKINAFGLYDMSGNVWEWCQDWYGPYSSTAQTNPTGSAAGPNRVFRGGGFGSSGDYCRSARRYGYGSYYTGGDVGFRLAR